MAAATDRRGAQAQTKLFALAGRRVFVAGHRGMVGSAIVRRLGGVDCEVVTVGHDRLDLLRQADTADYLRSVKPDVVIVAAAKVGGIHANSVYPADFIYQNLMIATNVIDAAFRADVGKLLFLGSSCIYPRLARQPMAEEELLSGPLEPTNEFYAIAKIAAVKLCAAYRRQYGADYISVMPTNVYGVGDNYHPQDSHVIAGLMRRFHDAKHANAPSVDVWGTGAPQREFIFADDLADACVFVLENYSHELHLNVGSGEEITTAALAGLIADVVGYRGKLTFDASRPDGAPRKLLDIGKLSALGWKARTPLRAGLQRSYADFVAREAASSGR
jgi:GDP-L-fucose synthase